MSGRALFAGLTLAAVVSACTVAAQSDDPDAVPPGVSRPKGQPKHDPRCRPTTAKFTPDQRFNTIFHDYANDNRRMDDWTGGDGTWSIPLPDGRTLWVIADSFLGRVHPPDDKRRTYWRDGSNLWFIRNTAIVQEADGRLSRSLIGNWRNSASWIPEPDRGYRFEPGAGVVEPESAKPGAPKVIRITGFLKRGRGNATVVRTAVVTVSLDTLRPKLPMTYLPEPKQRGRKNRKKWVFYGSSSRVESGWTYVYGATSNATDGQVAHVARVPVGRLNEPGAWRYWNGRGWGSNPERAVPVLRKVSHGYNVVKVGGTYVLFTMDATVHVGGLTQISTYWSCKANGPWRGPHRAFRPPEPRQARHIVTYNPHVNPQFWDSSGLLMQYDVNAFWGHSVKKYNDVTLNRPRFMRARFVRLRGVR